MFFWGNTILPYVIYGYYRQKQAVYIHTFYLEG